VRNTKIIVASVAFAASLIVRSAPAAAGGSETLYTLGGATFVQLAPSFLTGLKSLRVTPAPIGPGVLISKQSGVTAAFPITTGAYDTAPVSTELDHSGGLSLTANNKRASLTSFIIDSKTGKLSGLVTCNEQLAGRLPLFDLKLTQAPKIDDGTLKIDGVAVTLTGGAASALSSCLGTTVPAIAVGTAKVRAELGPEL
jgi:hypothetical protein